MILALLITILVALAVTFVVAWAQGRLGLDPDARWGPASTLASLRAP